VAPASANLIAKISSGQSDSLALCVLRAWDFAEKPCIICPAMNSVMWEHPATSSATDVLFRWGYRFIWPISKTLACNEVGKGAMASVSAIMEQVELICEQEIDTCNSPNDSINIDSHCGNGVNGKERLFFNMIGFIFGFIVIKNLLR
jgi:phosphopantothenoylcysteine synthetase/decarboxylase